MSAYPLCLEGTLLCDSIQPCNVKDSKRNRVPDPNDLLGHVLLAPIASSGEQASGAHLFVPKSFEANAMHRLFTADGLFRLSPFMQQCLMKALNDLNR